MLHRILGFENLYKLACWNGAPTRVQNLAIVAQAKARPDQKELWLERLSKANCSSPKALLGDMSVFSEPVSRYEAIKLYIFNDLFDIVQGLNESKLPNKSNQIIYKWVDGNKDERELISVNDAIKDSCPILLKVLSQLEEIKAKDLTDKFSDLLQQSKEELGLVFKGLALIDPDKTFSDTEKPYQQLEDWINQFKNINDELDKETIAQRFYAVTAFTEALKRVRENIITNLSKVLTQKGGCLRLGSAYRIYKDSLTSNNYLAATQLAVQKAREFFFKEGRLGKSQLWIELAINSTLKSSDADYQGFIKSLKLLKKDLPLRKEEKSNLLNYIMDDYVKPKLSVLSLMLDSSASLKPEEIERIMKLSAAALVFNDNHYSNGVRNTFIKSSHMYIKSELDKALEALSSSDLEAIRDLNKRLDLRVKEVVELIDQKKELASTKNNLTLANGEAVLGKLNSNLAKVFPLLKEDLSGFWDQLCEHFKSDDADKILPLADTLFECFKQAQPQGGELCRKHHGLISVLLEKQRDAQIISLEEYNHKKSTIDRIVDI